MKIKFVEKRIEQIKSIKTTVGLDEVKVQAKIEEAMNFRPTKTYGNIKDDNIDLVIFKANEIIAFENWYLLAIYIEIKHYRKHPEEVQDKLMSIIYQMYMEDKNGYSIQEIIDYMDDRYQEYFKNKIDIDQILQDFYDYKEEEWL